MLVLFETPAGFALFKLLNEGKISQVQDLSKDFATPEAASKIVKLKAFHKFDDTTEALEAATALVDGELGSTLKKFLKKQIVGKDGGAAETLAVADAKLGGLIKDKLKIPCIFDSKVFELLRGIRQQAESLIAGNQADLKAMVLGLSHSLSRYKLKFSPDKVDTMIVQAIGLLDDLDKELNTYAMRVREWYGWHFPEMSKVITDNIVYAKVVKKMGFRSNALSTEFGEILPEELEAELKEIAQISMGTEISDQDIENIRFLCDQVISLTEYRVQLYDYLKNRMQAIAPNLSVLLGEMVGARLIAHAGSLLNLAKHPASTVQILGAEKALFRALKTKHDTPKYGLIYHASLIGQAPSKHKGKISRVLAAKAALSIRVDALGDKDIPNIGADQRAKVEARIKQLDSSDTHRIGGSSKPKQKAKDFSSQGKAPAYNAKLDTAMSFTKSSETLTTTFDEKPAESNESDKKSKKDKKDKKRKTEEAEEAAAPAVEEEAPAAAEPEKKKKKKEKKEAAAVEETQAEAPAQEAGEKKKKKKEKKEAAAVEETQAEAPAQEAGEKKKKKKEKKDA
eukprot:TRINITY_DN900_c0_g1_i2.p1 TRINITY_DN900_c0_g1~~TRINITY_DN900_c0_g1_i2.p1  ORF type:complete len:567 (-),score=190.71 TRINITY_DN900_c0_g1_i2:361-2061(-)